MPLLYLKRGFSAKKDFDLIAQTLWPNKIQSSERLKPETSMLQTNLPQLGFCYHSRGVLFSWLGANASGDGKKKRSIPPLPKDAFGPSNAKTEDGKLIPVDQFFSARSCLGCHRDTHAPGPNPCIATPHVNRSIVKV